MSLRATTYSGAVGIFGVIDSLESGIAGGRAARGITSAADMLSPEGSAGRRAVVLGAVQPLATVADEI